MGRKSRVLEFPNPVTEAERRAVRRVKAAILAAEIESDVAVCLILKLENATEEQRLACLSLLDPLSCAGPNLELAVWAWKAPPEEAQAILSLANSFTDIERRRSSVLPKSRKRKS